MRERAKDSTSQGQAPGDETLRSLIRMLSMNCSSSGAHQLSLERECSLESKDQLRKEKSKTYIAVPAEILGIILPLLLGVAFLVLAERKVMAFVQRRKGPDVVGSFGLLQPLADGFKLILKEPISPSSANFSLFRMAPVATFMLSLVARAVVPFDYGMVLSDSNIGLLYLFAISSLGVYGIITAGWSSN
ncbi:hypothetical protein RIF29_47785 [Crotalaria pallida]|uniref:NADH dehydrogenase subunit 1 n=1 Tax=Crotalaria pallida TaxID=3830 RepID=A0AAN9HMN6_CROPI